MGWLAVMLILPIGYVLIGAAILATIDPHERLWRYANEHGFGEWLVLMWPWLLFVILTGPKTRPGATRH